MIELRAFGLSVAASFLFACSGVDASVDATESASSSEAIAAEAASASLTFQLVAHEYLGRGEWVTLPLSSLDEDAARLGLAPFADAITVGDAEDDKQAFLDVVARVEAVRDATGRDIEFVQDWNPSLYTGLCHDGPVAGVRAIVEGLRGVAFSRYMGLAAYRYEGTAEFLYGMDADEFFEIHVDAGNEDVVDAWKTFDTSSGAFLMLTDGGQQGDGTELFATQIPKCARPSTGARN